MASYGLGRGSWLLILTLVLVVLPGRAAAFGAGNIPSIAQVEGHNWRHGDIEDILKTLTFLHGKKWTSMLIKRTYFGNWLRDYSQAVDVGSLKGANAATIRILVWVLSFLSFGYATEEFEVTEERLGVYRPEEHIDNPLGYADNMDARKFDKRLRGPVERIETEIDPRSGMKNYIANEQGNWATSAGYLRFSFARSIHYGRVYTNGAGGSGKDGDLCEALRCLGQALHCMEDFSAHSNYCELALRELGYNEVFPHCGSATEININGRRAYPLVTGTFGAVDFLHSVIGEATDHFTQSEVDEMNTALKNAQAASKRSGGGGGGTDRGLFGPGPAGQDFISLVGQLPGIGDGFASQARSLKAASEQQEVANRGQQDLSRASGAKPTNANVVPGMSPDFDPVKVAKQIYPILEFRDKIVRAISATISKIPGLESLLEHIGETLTAFILGLLAPFVRPIINAVSKSLKDGSSGIISASAHSQLEPWSNPRCSDPTHSMLSKDHFTNVLNSCAGRVASTILRYVVPRILYAWENTHVPVDEVVSDVLRAFHHPAARSESIEIQRNMFNTVRQWANEHPRRGELGHLLSSESVKAGKNHQLLGKTAQSGPGHSHSPFDALGQLGHGKVAGSLWSQIKTRDIDDLQSAPPQHGAFSSPSPGLSPGFAPPQQSFGYSQPPPEQDPYLQPGYSGGGYNASPPPPPPFYQQSFGGPSPGYPPQGGQADGYWGSQQPPPPPPGQFGGYQPPPPTGQYGGPGYAGGPPQQHYAPYPPQHPSHHPQHPSHHHQQPPSWNQYPGSQYH